jgi:hypothetical protein
MKAGKGTLIRCLDTFSVGRVSVELEGGLVLVAGTGAFLAPWIRD